MKSEIVTKTRQFFFIFFVRDSSFRAQAVRFAEPESGAFILFGPSAKMAEGDDMEWLSDYILAFLKSPSWVAPIAQFVDEQCIIFEDVEENKLEYTECHEEYKELIDSRFAAHLLEIDVTGEQFEQFCQRGLSTNPTLHRVLVEQLLSADDFLIFKAMMTKRNADLYREAQRRVDAGQEDDYETMIEEEQDLGLGMDTAIVDEWKMYEEQLFQALDESQKADDQLARERQKEEEEMERAIALSLQAEGEGQKHDFEDVTAASSSLSAPSAPSAPAPAPMVEEPVAAVVAEEGAPSVVEEAAPPASGPSGAGGLPPLKPSSLGPLRPVIPRVMKVAPMNSRPGTAASVVQAEEASLPPPPPPDAAATAGPAVVEVEVPPPPPPPQPTEEERQARFEHLQRQRQLLVEKRNKDRQRQLEKSEMSKSPNRRAADQAVPGSAPAGPSLVRELTGGTGGTGGTDVNTAQQMRQVLASQLKQTLRSV